MNNGYGENGYGLYEIFVSLKTSDKPRRIPRENDRRTRGEEDRFDLYEREEKRRRGRRRSRVFVRASCSFISLAMLVAYRVFILRRIVISPPAESQEERNEDN